MILGPVLFNIFINDVNKEGIECILSKFAGDTDWEKWLMLQSAVLSFRRIERLGRWAGQKLLKFNKDKCRVLHLGRNEPAAVCPWSQEPQCYPELH